MPDLPYTYVVRKPNGKEYWRFRKGDLRAGIPGKPSEPDFYRRYAELIELAAPKEEVAEGTWSAVIAKYRASPEFRLLRGPTQLDYGKTLDLLDAELGEQPFRLTTRNMIKTVRDEHADTPRKAHKVKQMASRLYSWADENDEVPAGFNPAKDIKRLKARQKIITPWSEEEITLVLAKAPKHLVTPIMLALYTGQRAQDVVTMDWTAYQGAFIRVRQSKTGEPLDIACHKALRKHLDGIKTRFSGRIARAASGRPYTANGFAKALSDCIAKIEAMPRDRSPHGLRYAAAARLEEAGCTVIECIAVLGHRTYQMAVKYMAGRRAGKAAIERQEARA